jgi:predicted transcriptional regulator
MPVPDKNGKSVHITLRLDERLVAELRRTAKQNDRSVSAEARQALRDYLSQPVAA